MESVPDNIWTNYFDYKENLDLIFICANNIRVKTHKAVIATVSSFLKQIVLSCADDIMYISVPNIDHKKMEIMLCLIYQGYAKVNVQDLLSLKEIICLLGINIQSAKIDSQDAVDVVKKDLLNIFYLPSSVDEAMDCIADFFNISESSNHTYLTEDPGDVASNTVANDMANDSVSLVEEELNIKANIHDETSMETDEQLLQENENANFISEDGFSETAVVPDDDTPTCVISMVTSVSEGDIDKLVHNVENMETDIDVSQDNSCTNEEVVADHPPQDAVADNSISLNDATGNSMEYQVQDNLNENFDDHVIEMVQQDENIPEERSNVLDVNTPHKSEPCMDNGDSPDNVYSQGDDIDESNYEVALTNKTNEHPPEDSETETMPSLAKTIEEDVEHKSDNVDIVSQKDQTTQDNENGAVSISEGNEDTATGNLKNNDNFDNDNFDEEFIMPPVKTILEEVENGANVDTDSFIPPGDQDWDNNKNVDPQGKDLDSDPTENFTSKFDISPVNSVDMENEENQDNEHNVPEEDSNDQNVNIENEGNQDNDHNIPEEDQDYQNVDIENEGNQDNDQNVPEEDQDDQNVQQSSPQAGSVDNDDCHSYEEDNGCQYEGDNNTCGNSEELIVGDLDTGLASASNGETSDAMNTETDEGVIDLSDEDDVIEISGSPADEHNIGNESSNNVETSYSQVNAVLPVETVLQEGSNSILKDALQSATTGNISMQQSQYVIGNGSLLNLMPQVTPSAFLVYSPTAVPQLQLVSLNNTLGLPALVQQNNISSTCGKQTTSSSSNTNDDDDDVILLEDNDPISEGVFPCVFCGITFSSQFFLNDHVTRCKKKSKKEKTFMCKTCGKSFMTNAMFAKHLLTHKEGRQTHTCEICDAKFSELQGLLCHKFIHTREKPYKCQYCGSDFATVTHLKVHMTVHTGQKPFMCTFCRSGFNSLGSLKNHMTIHTGEKPYKCKVCHANFSRNEYLKRHFRIHTGELPYKCPKCEKRFRHTGTLNNHKKICLNTAEDVSIVE